MKSACRIVTLLSVVAVASASVATIQTDIPYDEADGKPLLLDVCVPAGDGSFPVAILVHGGGWTSGDKSGGPSKGYMAPLHDALTDAGFVWFSINYRLAPQYTYPEPVEDIETAIRWVKAHASQYHVDPNRIILSGESAGGHLVMAAAVRATPATHVNAVVPIYGRYDLVSDARATNAVTGSISALTGLTTFDVTAEEHLREASPLFHVSAALPPILLVHGDADSRVPYTESIKMQARLKEAGVPNNLLTIPGGDHGMLGWPKFMPDFKQRIVDWILRTLPSETSN